MDRLAALQAQIRACRACRLQATPVVAGNPAARIMVIGQAPGRKEQEVGQGWLDQELALLHPDLILLVGGMAIERFLGKVGLEEAVGQAIPWQGSLLFPLPHPSGASTWLNAPSHKALLHQGLERFRAEVAARGLF